MNVNKSLTIVILTKNESKNLSNCVSFIPKKYRCIVLDSVSDDDTVFLAKKLGCDTFINGWNGFAAQRNFALNNCRIISEWVLFVDVDEIYPIEFFVWFEKHIHTLDCFDVLMVPSCLFFNRQQLKFAPGYPILHPRLVRSNISPFTNGQFGHNEEIIDFFRIGFTKISYHHYFFDGDYKCWMHKHLLLALEESKLNRITGTKKTFRTKINLLFRFSLLRPFLRFFYHFFIRLGFLDGLNGLRYSLMYLWFELTKYFLITARLNEKS